MNQKEFGSAAKITVDVNSFGDYRMTYQLGGWETTRDIDHARWWSVGRDKEIALAQESAYIEYCFHEYEESEAEDG